jgi:hypothetical protein
MDDKPRVKWADITDDEPLEPPTVIDKNGIKVPYIAPHLRKIKKPPPDQCLKTNQPL